jgi:protein pelota
MRFKGKNNLRAGESGMIHLIIDNTEDLWALYNIMAVGDCIKLATFRKVQHETGNKSSSTKKKIIITIRIEEIEYSPEAIRFKGKNISENEYIAIGQYQTDEIGVNSFFSLYKSYWDDIHLETLKNATDVTVTSEIAAILMEEGIAHLFYISNNQTVTKGKVTHSIPKKRNGSTQHDKGKESFFDKVLNQLVKQINFENTKVLIIASPGFTKDDFKKFMEQKIDNNAKEWADLKSNLNKIIYTHSSSGFKHSLEEILIKPEIKRLIKDTKCIDDVSVMERFNEILGTDMDKVFFGHKAFDIAFEKKAIDTLIITDGYLRKIPASVRKDLSAKIKELKTYTVEVCQFSSLHPTGEKIDEFGGIVGILKYVVEEIAELGDEVEEEKDDKKVSGNIGEEIKDENLQELINDNLINYNLGAEEDQKDEKEKEKGKNKRKKTKDEVKEVAKQRKKNKRKRSSFGDEDNDDYDDVY